MALTNQTAFMVYCPDENLAELILTNKGITPGAADNLEISGAWGMIEKAKQADYSQGKTSETLSPGARALLIDEARAILRKYGISYQDHSSPTVTGLKW